jgi:hypothetical protein
VGEELPASSVLVCRSFNNSIGYMGAEGMSLATRTVADVLNAYAPPPDKLARPWTQHELDLLTKFVAAGLGTKEIAVALDRTYGSVHSRINRRLSGGWRDDPPPDWRKAEAQWAELLAGQSYENVQVKRSILYVEQTEGRWL